MSILQSGGQAIKNQWLKGDFLSKLGIGIPF